MSTTLHLVNRREAPPPEGSVAGGDAVVLVGEGVYLALADAPTETSSRTAVLHVLASDLARRGIEDRPLRQGVRSIDAPTLVDLALACQRSVSW